MPKHSFPPPDCIRAEARSHPVGIPRVKPLVCLTASVRAGARRSAAGACPPKRSDAFPGSSGTPFDPGRRSVCRSIRIAFRRHRSSRSSPGFAGVSFTDRSRDRPVFVGAEAPAEFHSAPRSPEAFSTPSGSVKAEASGFRIRVFTDRNPSSPTVPKLAFWDPVRPSIRKASSPSRRPRRVRPGAIPRPFRSVRRCRARGALASPRCSRHRRHIRLAASVRSAS
jgi:hypothetical protein